MIRSQHAAPDVDAAWLIRRVRQMSAGEVGARAGLFIRQAAYAGGVTRTGAFRLSVDRCADVVQGMTQRWGAPVWPSQVFGVTPDTADPVPRQTASYDVREADGFGPWFNWRTDRWGDIREFWERCRLQWLPGRVSRSPDPAGTLAEQVELFLSHHPPLRGPAWATGLEGAVRGVSVVYAAGMAGGSGEASDSVGKCLAGCRDLIRLNSSPGTSANNHALGEAAALALLSWVGQDDSLVVREQLLAAASQFLQQTHPDGSGREAANTYWQFNLDWARLTVVLAELSGTTLPADFHERFRRAEEVLGFGGLGRLAGFILGDTDDARIWWGDDRASDELSTDDIRRTYRAGLAQASVGMSSGERTQIVLRSGAFGFPSTLPHSHADQLALYLEYAGCPVIVDPGSDRYFGISARTELREACSHATFRVRGIEQARSAGRFLWTHAVSGEDPTVTGGQVSGRWESGSVRLSRHVRWNTIEGTLDIEDSVEGAAERAVDWTWPLAPDLAVESVGDGRWVATHPRFSLQITVSDVPEHMKIVTAPVSSGYAQRADGTRLELSWTGDRTLTWHLEFQSPTETVR